MNIKKKGGTKSDVRVQNPEPLNAEPRTLNPEPKPSNLRKKGEKS